MPPTRAARSRESHSVASRFVSKVLLVTRLEDRSEAAAGFLADAHAAAFCNHFSTSAAA